MIADITVLKRCNFRLDCGAFSFIWRSDIRDLSLSVQNVARNWRILGRRCNSAFYPVYSGQDRVSQIGHMRLCVHIILIIRVNFISFHYQGATVKWQGRLRAVSAGLCNRHRHRRAVILLADHAAMPAVSTELSLTHLLRNYYSGPSFLIGRGSASCFSATPKTLRSVEASSRCWPDVRTPQASPLRSASLQQPCLPLQLRGTY